jgi:type IV pilus assembly protein PilM
LQFFYSSSQVGQVDRIVLAGGCASIEGSAEVIAAKTGCEVTTANPFSNMSLSSKVRESVIVNDAPSLMIACGLAMRTAV